MTVLGLGSKDCGLQTNVPYLFTYCFVEPTGHDWALLWLFGPLELCDINLRTYLLTYLLTYITDNG